MKLSMAAYRMPELADSVVFDSQRDKRARAAQRMATARGVRLVPWTLRAIRPKPRSRRADTIPASRPPSCWKGVVMYLPEAAIDAMLRVIVAR
jgi:hypothetical protein